MGCVELGWCLSDQDFTLILSHQGPNIVYPHKPTRTQVRKRITSLNFKPMQGMQQQHRRNQPIEAKTAAPTKKNGYLVQSGIACSDSTETARIQACRVRKIKKLPFVEIDMKWYYQSCCDGKRNSKRNMAWDVRRSERKTKKCTENINAGPSTFLARYIEHTGESLKMNQEPHEAWCDCSVSESWNM